MNEIIQHIPGFADIRQAASSKFESIADLEKIHFVRGWALQPDFRRFSVDGKLLMAEFENSYWVVGYLHESVDLPKFDARTLL